MKPSTLIVLAAMVASGGAWAKGYHPIRPTASALTTEVEQRSFQAHVGSVYHSSNPANDVYDNGRYMGSDPDPRIRDSLKHPGRDN